MDITMTRAALDLPNEQVGEVSLENLPGSMGGWWGFTFAFSINLPIIPQNPQAHG